MGCNLRLAPVALQGAKFQYPLRVEVGCNCCACASHATHTAFQYPLRVEVGCNYVPLRRGIYLLGFQYPLRVEVGCNRIPFDLGARRKMFQYPLRVEVGCNITSETRDTTMGRVSVPSTGRSGLQQEQVGLHHKTIQSFSTLYGSKWVATSIGRQCRRSDRVSVPSTGRSGLQPGHSVWRP